MAIRKEYRKIGKFIKSAITLHDQTQVEAIFDFILKPKSESETRLKQKHKYQVEAYFFFPSQMQVDGVNYNKSMFLNDIRPLIRFQEPSFSYGEFKGKNLKHFDSPIISLKNYYASIKKGTIDTNQSEAIEFVRLFACAFSRFMHKKIETILKRFKDLKHVSENDPLIEEQIDHILIALDKIWDLLQEWRKLSEEFCHLDKGFLEELKEEIRLTNEFFSYRICESLSRVKSNYLSLGDKLGTEEKKLSQRISDFVKQEHKISSHNRYIWLKKDSSTKDREKFLVRYSALRRRMWSVLFLSVRTKRFFNFQKQLGFMVAAAFAAMWAALANLFMFAKFSEARLNQASVGNLGVGGFVIMVGIVLAYVLKDRIKEIGRARFKEGLFNQLPDNDESIQYQSANGKSIVIGHLREYAKIIDDVSRLPREIRLKRTLHEDFANERQEDGVIHYKKIIEIHGRTLAEHNMPIYGIHDILRFKIDRFTNRLGNIMQNYWGLEENADIFTLQIPKVYHIDMILKYSRQNSKKEMEHVSYDCKRLVINKSGLVRVDRLA